ncbi:hypothetical protein Poly30_06660 [Planctomycetes bacterium Poly30]|uniref:Uncharacterized protein n=1 Tax=Saltatorellus ferox TaxID=2528018 RepID=A0A518EM49_9BACT|nr:hypothetical protein Poly30_06660 [Planctomycetes bacterium Poly30]
MGNPGLDVVNVKADDVTSAHRQAELEAFARDLVAFEPTLIAVESESNEPGFADSGYSRFNAEEDLRVARDETVQIAYRLASEANVERVAGIDVSEGEIRFFPFEDVQAFAKKAGRSAEIDAQVAYFEDKAAAFEEQQSVATVSELLLTVNDPASIESDHRRFYYGMFGFADDQEQPGAPLNYGWYARNAIIFSRLGSVARPGDRVVVVYGAGHAYWLRHFVEETPGFELVELAEYVRK